jgi:2-polyprenyl-6-methoxyphenol hydroxylase-like FAD-dependent oxidoreductase
VWPSARFDEVRRDIDGHIRKVHQSIPSIVDRLPRARREEKWVGTAGVANYFRKPYGPGWALVGDAGYDKDPITAQGISDAFIDAENLTEALDAGFSGRLPLEDALARYQSTRDQRAKPMYEFTRQLARLEPVRRRCGSCSRRYAVTRMPRTSSFQLSLAQSRYQRL